MDGSVSQLTSSVAVRQVDNNVCRFETRMVGPDLKCPAMVCWCHHTSARDKKNASCHKLNGTCPNLINGCQTGRIPVGQAMREGAENVSKYAAKILIERPFAWFIRKLTSARHKCNGIKAKLVEK